MRIRRATGPQPPRSRVIHSRHPQGQTRPSAAPHGAGRVSGMPADIDDNTCPWQIRDRDGWRHGVLFTASADFLVAWYTASATLHRRTWAAANRRYGALVRRVRQARLGGDVDELEQACCALLHHGQARPERAADPRCVHPTAPDAGLGSRRRRHLPDRLRHLPAPADGPVRATRVLARHRRANSPTSRPR